MHSAQHKMGRGTGLPNIDQIRTFYIYLQDQAENKMGHHVVLMDHDQTYSLSHHPCIEHHHSHSYNQLKKQSINNQPINNQAIDRPIKSMNQV